MEHTTRTYRPSPAGPTTTRWLNLRRIRCDHVLLRVGNRVAVSYRLEFKTESEEALLRFKSAGLIHLSALVEIQREAIGLAELPWMVMLGWYLIVMMNMDTAASAVVIG